MAMRILLSSNAAVPLIITVLASETRTLDGIVVALTSKAEATDGSDSVHVEADLSVGRLGVLGQIDGWLCRWRGRCRGKWRPNGDASWWRGGWFAMTDGGVVAGDKIFVNLIEFGPVT